jgi:hypothetical protein
LRPKDRKVEGIEGTRHTGVLAERQKGKEAYWQRIIKAGWHRSRYMGRKAEGHRED